ncbi:MAG: Calx-beta domain-containing protein [Caldilineaceae bacterium]
MATRVVLTEILPVSLFSGVSFTSTLPITPVFGVPYIWQLPNIPVGEGGTIVVRGRTTFAATGATINNTATIHAREDITPTNDSATAVLTVRAPILNFVTTDLTVDENGGSATVQVQLDIPNPLGNVLVTYRSSQGTAQPGQDYTTVDNVLVIPAGQTSGSFTVPIVNDTLDEENETILLDLLNPVGAKLGAQGRAVLTIVDNDALPTLSVSGPDTVEHANVAEFVFTLSAASGRPITLTVNTINDTATAPADFVALVDKRVVIPAGTTTAKVQVQIVDDKIQEPAERFFLSVSATNATLTTGQAAATIRDNDGNTLYMPIISKRR